MKNPKSDRHMTAFLWIVFGVLGRLIPHPPNFSPMTSIALFGGSQLGRGRAFVVTILTMIVSDILIAWAGGHQIFGLWSIFTYTGFAAIVLAGCYLRTVPTAGRTLGFLAGSSLFYWVWTNFGVWIMGDGYPHTLDGLVNCYVMALPFLGNALVGDLVWGLVLFLSFQGVRKVAPRFGLAVQGA
ncbi:MAG TPA: DUF6580 family putative transport protein [Bdellovibrionota bacterium]|jgi:hypothetical protein